jgi:hypothetical protein
VLSVSIVINSRGNYKNHTVFNESTRQDFTVPTNAVFLDFCKETMDRYDIKDELVEQGWVKQIIQLQGGGFKVIMDNQAEPIFAKVVVCAIGPNSNLNIPQWATSFIQEQKLLSINNASQVEAFRMAHVIDLINLGQEGLQNILVHDYTKKKRDINVLVVGGGLTSPQLVRRLLDIPQTINVRN